MASSDDAMDAYTSGVWDVVAYINEEYMSEDDVLDFEIVLNGLSTWRKLGGGVV